jgi:hypothetical protein
MNLLTRANDLARSGGLECPLSCARATRCSGNAFAGLLGITFSFGKNFTSLPCSITILMVVVGRFAVEDRNEVVIMLATCSDVEDFSSELTLRNPPKPSESSELQRKLVGRSRSVQSCGAKREECE